MTKISRRAFIGNAAASASLLPLTHSQVVDTGSDWNMSAFHLLSSYPARVKQIFDVSQLNEGKFLNGIKNSLNGLRFGFGVPDSQIKVVAALHGPANLFNYDDFIWNKYKIGAWLKIVDPATGQPELRNPYFTTKAGKDMHFETADPNNPNSRYQDISIQALQHRGVQFLSCHTATEEQARTLIKIHSLSAHPEDLVKEMLAHILPGVLVVPSMSASIALLQIDGHYSYVAG